MGYDTDPPRALLRSVLAVAAAVLLAACGPAERDRAEIRVAGGDPAAGKQLVRDYGCTTCHIIPGVRGTDALVGPPLNHWARRAYIAGMLPNTPENLVAWIFDPRQVHPETAMPRVGATENDARHIAAYLYTLQ